MYRTYPGSTIGSNGKAGEEVKKERRNTKPKIKNLESGTPILEIPTGSKEIDFMDRLKTHLAKTFLKPGSKGEICMYLGPDDDDIVVIHLRAKGLVSRELTEITQFSHAAYFGFCVGKARSRLQK